MNEIWHGGTSNRLININTSQNVIYYSTGVANSYGTYAIDEVLRNGAGLYKIIAKTNGGYKVFFAKNVSQQSYDFSVCQSVYKTKEEIRNLDTSYCDHFNRMSLYYENNPGYRHQ